jgi:hypothetical protein
MKRVVRGMILSGLLLILVPGCRTAGPPGGALPNADKYTINVLVQPGATSGLGAADLKLREQVRSSLEKELVSVLSRRGGFKSFAIKAVSQFSATADQYLLLVTITGCSAGSKSAKIAVGAGQGDAALDVHYELSGNSPGALMSANDSVSAARDSSSCVRKVSEDLMAAVTSKLR